MIHRLHRLLESSRPWSHLTQEKRRSQVYEVNTSDGVGLVLHRVRPRSLDAKGRVVMLLHGLGSNHQGFHLPNRSMATWLAGRGHDVWMPELRGHGRSVVERYDWCLDDYLEYDIPALIEGIKRFSGSDRIDWVGHSMGGILLMCYGALHHRGDIERGVAIGSALDLRVGSSGFERLLMLRPLLEPLVAIPYGSLAHLVAPALGRGGLEAVETFNAWPENVETEVFQQLHARCFHSIPTSLLSHLATAFEEEGLRLKSGTRIGAEIGGNEIPIRLISGSQDRQVAAEAVEHTAEMLKGRADLVTCDPGEGYESHYGHWDLVMGRRAETEVWPAVAEWIES